MKRDNEGTQYSAIVARYREHIRRVALIGAVAAQESAVTGATMLWARDLVRHCIEGLMTQAERYVADSEAEATKKRVLEVVRKYGPMTGNELTRKTQFLRGRDRQEVLIDLLEAGLISIQKLSSTGGRPTNLYKVV